MQRFLIIRFSSIGDIILTTPIIRSLHYAYPSAEIHFLTKPAFTPLLLHNPYLYKIHSWDDPKETLDQLRKLRFNHIIDLHRNLRSWKVRQYLRRPYSTFPKKNMSKWIMVRFKQKSITLPHIVERYADSLSALNVNLDDKGLDLFIPKSIIDEANAFTRNIEWFKPHEPPLAVVLGAKHYTKRWIPDYFTKLLNQLNHPIILIGGDDAKREAQKISSNLLIPYKDMVGKGNLLLSAAIMKNCSAVLTHDTGFMHIAAAFQMKIYSIWGNTVPTFGMTPYKTSSIIIEHANLSCRPCSKIGFDSCPKGHFKCMKELTPEVVFQRMREHPFY